MRFDWDPEKREANLRKHGIDFVAAIRIFDGLIVERQDDRFDYGEVRMAAIGVLNGVEITVYYTDRDDCRRIISARRATRNERETFYRALSY